MGPDGAVYVADYLSDRVRYLSPEGQVSTVVGSGELSGLAGPALHPDGSLYVGQAIAPRLRVLRAGRLESVEGMFTAAVRLPTRRDVAVGPGGEVLMADYGTGSLGRVVEDRTEVLAGDGTWDYRDGPAAGAAFANPWGIGLDPRGNVYGADRDNHAVRVLWRSGDPPEHLVAWSATSGHRPPGGNLDGPPPGSRPGLAWKRP